MASRPTQCVGLAGAIVQWTRPTTSQSVSEVKLKIRSQSAAPQHPVDWRSSPGAEEIGRAAPNDHFAGIVTF
jgi:hypothetical protein